MAGEVKKVIQLEIGHVLFIDIVGYSKFQGKFFWNKRTSDRMMKSIDYFIRAIEKDPAYALAYAGLADAYAILPNYSQTAWNESYPRGRAAVLKALELDDNVAEAHCVTPSTYRPWVGLTRRLRR
jgi:hypothetical protein